MSSFKHPKKIYDRPCIVPEWDVMDSIFDSERLGWSWCEELRGVHHTAIVLYLDFEARYTVNWTPKNGTKIASVVMEKERQLIFEDQRHKDHNDFDYKPAVEEYDLITTFTSDDDQTFDDFMSLLEKLTSFKFDKYQNKDSKGDAEFYDLASCNCRDHVESVLRDILPSGDVLCKELVEINSLRRRPTELLLYNLAGITGRFVSAFGRIAGTLLSSGELLRMRFFEKWQAKATGPFCFA